MKLFITGGAGFIGSWYVKRAISQGYEVTVYDLLTYAGNLSTLKEVENKYNFIQGNICDYELVLESMKNHDAVVHFAAESHVDRSITSPYNFAMSNVVGTNAVMEAALRNSIERVVHISTDETYGTIEHGEFKESDKLTPRSVYSATKAGSDLVALSYHTTYGLSVSVTRSSNNFGPFQYPEKLIPLFVTNLMRGKKVPLMGDGGNIRDWLYVEDNCSAIDIVLSKGKAGEIYNIGACNYIDNKTLTYKILEIMNKDESFIEWVPDRLGHDRRYSVDISKITSLGWNLTRDFDKTLESTVKWYVDNTWWIKDLNK